jgi:hypothetical protein
LFINVSHPIFRNELKINTSYQLKYATDEDLRGIGLSRPEIRRLRKFYEKYFSYGYLSKLKRFLNSKREENVSNSEEQYNVFLMLVFKKMCSIEIAALSVRPYVPYFLHISAPRELNNKS